MMGNMEPRWDAGQRRWECSTGSGANRKWFRTKIPGQAGRELVLRKRDEFLNGEPGPTPGTLAHFIECVWWPRLQMDSSINTRKKYRDTINRHFDRWLGRSLHSITLEELQLWVRELQQTRVKGKSEDRKTLSPKTVISIYMVLHQILDLAHKVGRMDSEEFRAVKLPTVPRKRKPERNWEELQRLVAAAEGTEFAGPILAAARLGLRRGEILGLKRSDITIVEQHRTLGPHALIDINNNRQAHGDQDALKNRDEGEARILAVPIAWAREMLAQAHADAIYVFTSPNGAPFPVDRITKAMPALCRKAGIAPMDFRHLRNFCRSRLAETRAPETVIMDALGHKSAETSRGYQEQQLGGILAAYTALASTECPPSQN